MQENSYYGTIVLSKHTRDLKKTKIGKTTSTYSCGIYHSYGLSYHFNPPQRGRRETQEPPC